MVEIHTVTFLETKIGAPSPSLACNANKERYLPMPAYRFGKHPPLADYRTLRFKSYLSAAIAPPPPSANSLTRVYANLKTSDPATLFPRSEEHTSELQS